jgi:hypothetical protein
MRIRVRHVFLAALAVWVGDVAAIPYTFTKIADLEALATFDAAPSVNNSGTVAFSGHVQGVDRASSRGTVGRPRPSLTQAENSAASSLNRLSTTTERSPSTLRWTRV